MSKFTSRVISGHGRGKRLGFPTFNLTIPKQLSADFGVYACRVWIAGRAYAGALHYGPVPTFNEALTTLEVYVLDYDSDGPVEQLQFELVDFIREIQQFSNGEELTRQIALDVQQVRGAYSIWINPANS